MTKTTTKPQPKTNPDAITVPAPKNDDKSDLLELEGEGSYTAARRYDSAVQKDSPGETQKLAEEAKKALEGPEAEKLLEAERIGKGGKPKHQH